MPNRSGFVDFNQFFGANAAAEEEQLRAAMERAQGLDATANAALRKSRMEAEQQAFGGGDASITSVGSYSDYLDAKRNAANAWAAMNSAGADPRTASVRQRLLTSSPLGQAAGQAQAARSAMEQRTSADVDAAAAGGLATRQWQGRQDERRKAEADARSRADTEARQAYLASLGNPSDWQQRGGTMSDAQSRAQGWLRAGGWRGDAKRGAGSQSNVARQLAWGDWSLAPGQRFATGGEEAEKIQASPWYRNEFDQAIGFGED